jgi:hypothetical protein
MFPHHFHLSNLSEFLSLLFSLLRIFCKVIKKTPFALLLKCSSFYQLFHVLLFSEGCFCRRISQIAVILFFLVLFADSFLPAALGKGRTTSGVKDVLGEGFGSARVLLEGPDSGELILEASGSADSSWLVFTLFSLDAAQGLWLVCL